MKCLSFISVFMISFLILLSPVFPQESSNSENTASSLRYYSEEEYQVALTKYVTSMLTSYYSESLPQERFLIALMRLVNNEMGNRITNRREAIERYFNDLRNQISELQQL